MLAELAARLPLGIVTGRPRADAERFLARFGLDDLFAAVVALDDAPGQAGSRAGARGPAPPGRGPGLAGGRHPRRPGAAAAAGVLPLGIRPPCAADDTGPALAAAGAARILDDLASLKELLP